MISPPARLTAHIYVDGIFHSLGCFARFFWSICFTPPPSRWQWSSGSSTANPSTLVSWIFTPIYHSNGPVTLGLGSLNACCILARSTLLSLPMQHALSCCYHWCRFCGHDCHVTLPTPDRLILLTRLLCSWLTSLSCTNTALSWFWLYIWCFGLFRGSTTYLKWSNVRIRRSLFIHYLHPNWFRNLRSLTRFYCPALRLKVPHSVQCSRFKIF